jgi:hypothetical protein
MPEQPLVLFDKLGPACTNGVVEAVRRRLEGDGPSHLVVASISGRTALSFAQALAGRGLSIVCVTGAPYWDLFGEYESPRPEAAVRRQLEELGVTVVDRMISSFGDTLDYGAARFGSVPASWLVAETLVAVGGYGLKTAVEVTLMATDAGAVPPFSEVLAVAGTDRGADTAAVVVSTFACCFFSLKPERRFQVKEILAMPRNKTWYKTMDLVCGEWRVDERETVRRRARR